MRLSALPLWKNTIEVLHDADFHALTFDMRNVLPQTLTYCGAATYLQRSLSVANVSAVLTTRKALEEFLQTSTIPEGKGVAVSDAPKTDFFTFHNHLAWETNFYHRSDKSSIGERCTIGRFASIDSHNVVIGDNVVIEDFVRIGANTIIGNGTIIRSGTVIGGDGFQFMRFSDTIMKVAHAGGVRIGSRVELQASCMIDKHIFGGDTLVGNDCKFADGAHVAHCAKVGARTLLAAGAIVLGSTVVGDDVWVGPGAIISNEIDVGNNAFITLGAVVTRNVGEGEKVSGNFAIPHERFLEQLRKVR
ncbi:MAG: UDP-3-O-(3-hydroxymyristoyl)glucosamine N-acyltransferase [Candidatus Kapabacteria bacterium]|jgi:UDP-3-O-[3-hydroxymyristoyl] glucosamine N-acyltransferase|nr:UDP-3-O-(3-hydroxymyristoyl)glucosamine N-acyltransferase [Candidatus Kapabacteria bacterium]